MKDFVSLKVLDKFKFLYEKLGIDYDCMRLILSTKLTSDSRRDYTVLRSQNAKVNSNNYKITLLIHAIVGFFMMFIILRSKNIFISMSIYFTVIVFFILTTFISDFSSVMLNTKDKEILAARGVSLKTLNASKISHIMIYMLTLSMALSGFPLIVSIKNGLIFFFVFFIEIIIIAIFSIVLSGLIYLIVLKLFNGEKLKDAINIMQICITIFFSGAYFISSDIIENITIIKNFDFGIINYFLPPFWFAAPFEIIETGNKNKSLLILSFLSVFIPLISTLIYVKLSPIFEKKLQKLNNEGSTKNKKNFNLTLKISNIICKNEEKIFFNFISKIIKKDRDIKLRIYPHIGIYCTFPIYMIFNKDFKNLDYYLFLGLYFCLMVIPHIVMSLKYSNDYKASYIYVVTTTRNIPSIHKATFKACLINLIIPIYLIESIVFTYFYKYTIIPNLVVIFLVLIFITIITFKAFNNIIPFSLPFDLCKKNESIATNYLIIILVFIMACIHFLISIFGNVSINIYILILLVLDIMLFKVTFKLNK